MGAECHAQGITLPVKQRLQLRFQRTLADPGGAQLHIRLARTDIAPFSQARQHLLDEHRLQLVRRPWQHAQHLSVLFHPLLIVTYMLLLLSTTRPRVVSRRQAAWGESMREAGAAVEVVEAGVWGIRGAYK